MGTKREDGRVKNEKKRWGSSESISAGRLCTRSLAAPRLKEGEKRDKSASVCWPYRTLYLSARRTAWLTNAGRKRVGDTHCRRNRGSGAATALSMPAAAAAAVFAAADDDDNAVATAAAAAELEGEPAGAGSVAAARRRPSTVNSPRNVRIAPKRAALESASCAAADVAEDGSEEPKREKDEEEENPPAEAAAAVISALSCCAIAAESLSSVVFQAACSGSNKSRNPLLKLDARLGPAVTLSRTWRTGCMRRKRARCVACTTRTKDASSVVAEKWSHTEDTELHGSYASNVAIERNSGAYVCCCCCCALSSSGRARSIDMSGGFTQPEAAAADVTGAAPPRSPLATAAGFDG